MHMDHVWFTLKVFSAHKGEDQHWVNVFARATRIWWYFLYFDGFGVKHFIHATVFRGEYHLTQSCK